MPRSLKVVLTVLVALGVGFAGLALVFSDVGPTETEAGRALSAVVLFLGTGLALGFLNPEGRAWMLAGIAAWAPAVLGATGLWYSLTNPASADLRLALAFLLGPSSLALAGGWLGARWRRARAERGRSSEVR